MVQYARTDTHFLLYIYDCVRAQLLDVHHGQPGLLQSVWNKSKDISLKVCTKPHFIHHEDPIDTQTSTSIFPFHSFQCRSAQFILLLNILTFPPHNFICRLRFGMIDHVPPLYAEICEAHIHRGVVFGAAEEAQKVFQHPAAHCLQTAVCLEGQAGQAGR